MGKKLKYICWTKTPPEAVNDEKDDEGNLETAAVPDEKHLGVEER